MGNPWNGRKLKRNRILVYRAERVKVIESNLSRMKYKINDKEVFK